MILGADWPSSTVRKRGLPAIGVRRNYHACIEGVLVTNKSGETHDWAGQSRIREYPIPDVSNDGALVSVEMSGVCGTDVKYLHGKRQQMPRPIILGHEILGRVVKIGREAASIRMASKKGIALSLKVLKAAARASIAAGAQLDFVRNVRVTGAKLLAPTHRTFSMALPTIST